MQLPQALCAFLARAPAGEGSSRAINVFYLEYTWVYTKSEKRHELEPERLAGVNVAGSQEYGRRNCVAFQNRKGVAIRVGKAIIEGHRDSRWRKHTSSFQVCQHI